MATTTKKTTGTTETKKTTKKRVRATARPDSGATAAPAVDPFATTASATAAKKPVGDNIHNAPTNDEELGNIAADIAEFAAAKAEVKTAEARLAAVSGNVMSFAKRILLGLIAKTGSKPKGQKLIGDKGATVTVFYQDRTVNMAGDTGRYETLCSMFGKETVDADIAEFTGWSIADEKMADTALVEKMKKALQAALTPEELTGLFVAKHASRKGVVDKAAKLCDKDTDKIDQLLQLTVPKVTLK